MSFLLCRKQTNGAKVSYKKVVVMELSEMIRRKKDGQSISKISQVSGRDRKTIRKYIWLHSHEVASGEEGVILSGKRLQSIVEKTRKHSSRQKIFEKYYEEIKGLLSDKKNKLKIKSVYEVIFFQAEDGIRDWSVTGVQTCALPISSFKTVSSRRRHTRLVSDWSSDVCSSDLEHTAEIQSLTNLVCRLLLGVQTCA